MTAEPKIGPNKGNAGKGRPKGSPNRLTANLKEAILGAFDTVGGPDYLVSVANSDPRTFCTLLGKVLPMQIAGADNEDGTPGEIVVRILDPRING